MPEGQFRLERKAYQQYLEKCKSGDISYLRLQNSEEAEDVSNVVFFGANYDDYFPIKNLYKAMNLVKPDAILVQLRPDVLLRNFKIDELRVQTGELDEKKYLK